MWLKRTYRNETDTTHTSETSFKITHSALSDLETTSQQSLQHTLFGSPLGNYKTYSRIQTGTPTITLKMYGHFG